VERIKVSSNERRKCELTEFSSKIPSENQGYKIFGREKKIQTMDFSFTQIPLKKYHAKHFQ